jgi:hypothetical protein
VSTTTASALAARPVRRPLRAVVRGALAVAVFIVSALDALLAAWLGTPRLGWLARRAAAACADEYRLRASGAVDAVLVADGDGPEPAAAGGQDPSEKEGASS